MAKSRAVAVRTRVVTRVKKAYRSGSWGGSKGRISVAVLGGLFVPIRGGLTNWQHLKSGKELMNYYIRAFTGYNPDNRAWNSAQLMDGLIPVLAGFFIHAMANRFGINRMIARAIPYVSI